MNKHLDKLKVVVLFRDSFEVKTDYVSASLTGLLQKN